MTPRPPPVRLSKELCEEYRRNGAVKLEGFLDEQWLNLCREKYDWGFANPSVNAGTVLGSRNYFDQIYSIANDPALEEKTLAAMKPLYEPGSPFAEARN